MVANEEEIEPMKMERFNWLALLFLLLLMTGCDRREVLDEYPVSGVEITLDWSGVTDQLPDGMRAIFYPKNAGGKKVEKYLSVRGGNVKVPPGRYSMVIYNYDTESLRIRDEAAYETIEAFTGNCNEMDVSETADMVWEPDLFYVVSEQDVKIEKSDEVIMLSYRPKLVVKTYTFEMKVKGMQYVADVVGSISGMANCYHLGTGWKENTNGPVQLTLTKSAEGISGSFRAFGMCDALTRVDVKVALSLMFIKTDKTVQTQTIDVTEAVKPLPPAEGGTGGGQEEQPEISLPTIDEPIEVEKPTNPPSGGGNNGGIGGDVGDWGDEDEVELPVK